MMEHLWNSYYVQMRITYREHSRDGQVKSRIRTFDCDSHIAEAVRLLNEKGYEQATVAKVIPTVLFRTTISANTRTRRTLKEDIYSFAASKTRKLFSQN